MNNKNLSSPDVSQEACFTRFKTPINSDSLPKYFTFPFYYQPHPLCLLAAKELQDFLSTQPSWQHPIGRISDKEATVGKMFGVLLVQNKNQEVGYLSAFSGTTAASDQLSHFVPPVFDLLTESGFFKLGQSDINQISAKIKWLDANPHIGLLTRHLKMTQTSAQSHIQAHRNKMIEGRKARKEKRAAAEALPHFLAIKNQLAKESIQEKNQLRDLTDYWHEKVKQAEDQLAQLVQPLLLLKAHRKTLSVALQQKIFDQYQFLNTQGITKSLSTIFKHTTRLIPPSGAGDCAAPKLLHYAFKSQLKPLAMAEFWWGASPKSEIKKHLHFYPACRGKCEPILGHMLEGIDMDENLLLVNLSEEKEIVTLYQDEVMLVINKPEGLLSVPGKTIADSVYQRIKQHYPDASSSLIVHRLDMSTSGLMLIALSKAAHKHLQKQFIKRTLQKRYIALLDGLITEDSGFIDLPLRVDLEDRPRQLVCHEFGRHAQTKWQVIERQPHQTKVYFYPITGRTHQLRVHAAHCLGLNHPIIGDDLYGTHADRLHLHADWIAFNHPITNKLMSFQCDAGF